MWNQIFNFNIDNSKDINDIVQNNINFDLSPNLIKKDEKDTNLFYSSNIIEFKDFRPINGLFEPSFGNDNLELYFINDTKIRNINSQNNENDSSIEKEKDKEVQKKDKYIINDSNSFKKDKIFKIKKALKLGRKKKNSSKKGKHDKFQRDNLIRRFKAQLMKSIYNYINNCFVINNHENKNKMKIIKKIYPFYQSIEKEENIKWLNSKIKDIFSQKLTNKFITCDLDYNEKLIKKIYEEGIEKKAIKNLDKTIKEYWNIYIKDDKDIDFTGFETIKDDIVKFRKSGETEEYIAKYIEIAHKYEKIFKDIVPRKKKTRKINNI